MLAYPLRLEISGPIALWARPDTMPNPVSYVAPTPQHPLRLDRGEGRVRCRVRTYVAPTFSSAKGIFEAILRWKSEGSAGDSPAPVGDPPNGIAKSPNSIRRVPGRNRRVACATHAFNYGGPQCGPGLPQCGLPQCGIARILLARVTFSCL